ncbi:MAG: nucleotidyltransferase family protein [Roseburia sp.]
MKVIGIIAEYNPFHNGHAYQIEKIKKDLQADYIVVAMSGDFVQRGAPAILDKYARTKMALSCGADLVIELPVLWATSSAESFAMAGVTLFEKMGCVDGICFGAETDDFALLEFIADILADEPIPYRRQLAFYLKEGKNFPTARALSATEYICQNQDMLSTLGFSSFELLEQQKLMIREKIIELLSSPNNILAIEYLKAIKRRGSSLKAYLLKREGAAYHDTQIMTPEFTERSSATDSLSQDRLTIPKDAPIASATGIRNLLSCVQLSENSNFPAALATSMPKTAIFVLREYLSHYPALNADNFSAQLGYQLLLRHLDGFSAVMDCTEEISNRICKNIATFSSFSDFCENNKSRDITYTRMSRILLHLLLNIDKSLEELGKNLDYIPYLRILGFRKNTISNQHTFQNSNIASSQELFSLLKKSASVPVISKLADAKKQLSEDAMTLLEKDIFAADFYEQVKVSLSDEKASFKTEYSKQIVIFSSL